MVLLYFAALILAGILAAILKACKVPYHWLISGVFFIGICAGFTAWLDWTVKNTPYP